MFMKSSFYVFQTALRSTASIQIIAVNPQYIGGGLGGISGIVLLLFVSHKGAQDIVILPTSPPIGSFRFCFLFNVFFP